MPPVQRRGDETADVANGPPAQRDEHRAFVDPAGEHALGEVDVVAQRLRLLAVRDHDRGDVVAGAAQAGDEAFSVEPADGLVGEDEHGRGGASFRDEGNGQPGRVAQETSAHDHGGLHGPPGREAEGLGGRSGRQGSRVGA